MGMLRRLSGVLGEEGAHHVEPESAHHHHHHHHHHGAGHRSHRKNYSVPVLGGNRPIAISNDAHENGSPVTKSADTPPSEDKPEKVSRSRASSTSSSGTHKSAYQRHTGAKSLTKTSEVVVEYDDDDDVRARARAHRSAHSSPVRSGLPERSNTSASSGEHILLQSKRISGTIGPGSPRMSEAAAKVSALERARRRNTYTGHQPPYPVPAGGHTPFPATPPVSAPPTTASDYVAYHPPADKIPPVLRPAGGRSRASSTVAETSRPVAAPLQTTSPTVVEIGSSDIVMPTEPRRADSGKSFGSRTSNGSGPRREDPYDFLREFDTVFVVDDSASMDGGDLSRWNETREALETVAAVATRYDADGIDIKFLNNHALDTYNITSASAIRGLFRRVQPSGCTPTGRCLDEILREYIDRYAAYKKAALLDPDGPRQLAVKPLNIVVLTDGEPTDDPESVIVDAARNLERLNAPLHQVGIQFVQIGDEPGAREALEELDDALAGVYHIRDMVDTTPYNGIRLTGETVLKVLLGGVNRRIDRRKNTAKTGADV